MTRCMDCEGNESGACLHLSLTQVI